MPPRTRQRTETFEPSIHPNERSGNFRLNAKHLFLTYPRYSCDKQQLFDFINLKYRIKRCIIAEETHEDGARHMHAYVEFQKKVDLRHWDVFDHDGHHCNLGAARKPDACINYCNKEDTSPFCFGNLDCTNEIDSLCALAEETPEESEWIDLCFSKKVNHTSIV